ncbi:MAG TPA: autoinducer binding domain-containing protein [Burkholderiales bacterium]|nr:autoinducer binding domain-containing protein [Burkholderiales bacterium]
MGRARPDPINSFEFANESISWISGYENEAAVDDAARQIVRYFGLEAFVFGALFRSGEREHYRYLVGCKPEWCFLYNQNKWYAIDPFIEYALHHTSPVLALDIPLTSPGQQRMMTAAAEHGFRSGVVVPAHSDSSARVGVLYLGTDEGPAFAHRSFVRHRSLMRAFAMELLEWWDARLRHTSVTDLELDDLDVELLYKAQNHATAEEAARELGVTVSRVKARYQRLHRKLEAPTKRYVVERAEALGLIKPTP